MEYQNEYESIERRFLSVIEHCGINKDDYPIPTPARGIVGTPSFFFSTPGSLTRVTGISNLAEEDTFNYMPQNGNDQSLCDDSVVTVLAEDTNDTTFFSQPEDELREKSWDHRDAETSQCVPSIDFRGEKIYRVVEGCESGPKGHHPKTPRKSFHPRGSSTMINHMTPERPIKTSKLLRKKNSHPRACSTFIGKDAMVEETIDAECNSFWSSDDSSSTLCVAESLMEKSESLFLQPIHDNRARIPRTSTRIHLDNQRVPDINISAISGTIADSLSQQLTKTRNGGRHLALRDSGVSSCSTLGSMGDNSVFEKPQEEPLKKNVVKKTGLLRRQTCKSKLLDKKALVKKIQRFNNSLRSQEFRDAHTLLVI